MTQITDPGTHGFDVPSFRPFLKCDVVVQKGGHYAFNLVGGTSLVEGAEGYVFGHVIDIPANASLPAGDGRYDSIAWAEEDGAVGDIVRFTVMGVASVLVASATVQGDLLIPATNADDQLDLATGTSDRNIVARALEADTNNFATCWVSGLWPIGYDGSGHT